MRFVLLIFLISSYCFAAPTTATTSKAAPAAKPIPLGERLKAASQRYAARNYDQVVQLLNPYTEELPLPGLMILANSYSKKNLFTDEIRVLKILAGKNEKSYEAQMLLGQAYLKMALEQKDPNEQRKTEVLAIQSFRACLKIRPGYKPAFDTLLAVLLDEKDQTDARELLTDGFERFGRQRELMAVMCRLDSSEGFVEQALQSCHEAIRLNPAHPDNYVFLAQSLFDEKENAQSEHELVNAAKRFPASEFVQWSTATVFLRKKDYPVSSRYFGQAVKADPNSERSVFGYAQSLFESGQMKEALPYFKKACQMDPKNVVEPFYSASSRLRQKGDALGDIYKEGASSCHSR